MTNSRDKEKLTETIHKQEKSRGEERTTLDQFSDQKFVDDIPLDDLKIELEEQKRKRLGQPRQALEDLKIKALFAFNFKFEATRGARRWSLDAKCQS